MQNNKDVDQLLSLSGVGEQTIKHLSRLHIHSIKDLLFHLPLHYQDRTQIQLIRTLIPGREAVIEGVVEAVSIPHKVKTKLLCELTDETGVIHLRFFHVLAFQKNSLKPGTRLRCYGEVKLGKTGFEMHHPEFKVINENNPLPIETHLTPTYPATEGLSQYTLRKITSQALKWLENKNAFPELLPDAILNSLSFPKFKDALQFIHRPAREANAAHLLECKTLQQRRLIFEELVTHRISLLHVKKQFQSQQGIALPLNQRLIPTFLQQLPFQLTNAQTRVVNEIQQDLNKENPMLRLVQGDVGSGKTVVAALAMLQAIENHYQAVLMAPTELLAEQHYRSFKRWFEPLGLQVVFLSGAVKGKARREILEKIASGEAHIILGTHALFQDEVLFAKLALMVIDEQHRFGVHQRAMLREKGMQDQYYPHQLVMTATPIPRTLAMSFYADLDCSVIDELPPGRTPIVTSVITGSRRPEIIERIREASKQGRQTYWVCPLIEESEVLNCQAATKMAEELQLALPELKIGLVHGRMSSKDKEAVMQAFQQGHIHLLVATTVIEVGVDVPNASLMVIENAERLGLSQLHQLRGRVGRGSVASHCILLYQYPLSNLAKERLQVMRESTDGFKIAQRDLELRGPGEVLGTRQTGELSFKVADLVRDSDMVQDVQQAADVVMRDYPHLIEPLVDRWLGKNKDYGKI